MRFARPGPPSLRLTEFEDFAFASKYVVNILIKAPFAAFLLPIYGWKQAQANGEGP